MAQSQDFSWNAGTICGAPIKVSYYVFMMYGFQIYQIVRGQGSASGSVLLFSILVATGVQAILLITVLCHEFGHGNMARYLGGQIDHILLWVFGGICFHTRPPSNRDNAKILRNDFLVVAAGPSTHFLQAPLWGCLMFLVFFLNSSFLWMPFLNQMDPWEEFLNVLNPLAGIDYGYISSHATWGSWLSRLLWILVQEGVQMNVGSGEVGLLAAVVHLATDTGYAIWQSRSSCAFL
ncbi:unnamed protein product [Prorocentrum cordatum]|uniref:Peptidase M50 domain-containing protein n=1 Tax=Prorocentrum cordatum TaxID=2364126 RepID=A0ABN9V652_9DINO|nr:unnamed protein product [Polarella glacialis]